MIGNFYSGTYTFAMEGMNYGATCITLPYVLGKDLGSGKAQLTRTHPSPEARRPGPAGSGHATLTACVTTAPVPKKALPFWQVSAESEATLRTRKNAVQRACAAPHQGGMKEERV